MRVCMHVCLHLCMHACMNACEHACMHECAAPTLQRLHVCIHARTQGTSPHELGYVCMHVCVCACACMYVCMYVCMHVCMCVCAHTCIHACAHTYVCVCVHTHIHILIHMRMHIRTHTYGMRLHLGTIPHWHAAPAGRSRRQYGRSGLRESSCSPVSGSCGARRGRAAVVSVAGAAARLKPRAAVSRA